MSFWRDGNFAEALDLYYEISSEDNTDAEAYWKMFLCKFLTKEAIGFCIAIALIQ